MLDNLIVTRVILRSSETGKVGDAASQVNDFTCQEANVQAAIP